MSAEKTRRSIFGAKRYACYMQSTFWCPISSYITVQFWGMGCLDRTDSKIWEKDPVEKIHTYFYKHFIGLNRRATNIISRNEAERLSLKSNISIAKQRLLLSNQPANNGNHLSCCLFTRSWNYTVTLLLINYSSLVYSHESQN